MKSQLISVVIPAYNAEKYIAAAVVSVFSQGYENIEIIVVNDGSTDRTVTALAEFGEKIKIISQDNKGQAAARNIGIREANGELIGLLDADDIWPADHVSLMLPHLAKDSPYDFARGLTQYIKDVNGGVELMDKKLYMEALVGACLYKKSIFEKVGLFYEEMRQGEDFDWSIRLLEAGCREKRIGETALFYRRHGNNLTNNNLTSKGQLDALRKKIARMRLQPGENKLS